MRIGIKKTVAGERAADKSGQIVSGVFQPVVRVIFHKCVNDRFAFFGFTAADRIDQNTAGFDLHCQTIQKSDLPSTTTADRGFFHRPFGVRISAQHAEAGAGCIEQNAVVWSMIIGQTAI